MFWQIKKEGSKAKKASEGKGWLGGWFGGKKEVVEEESLSESFNSLYKRNKYINIHTVENSLIKLPEQ